MPSDHWLEDLRGHPIFGTKATAASASSSSQLADLDGKHIETSSQRKNLIAIRQTDLIVAVGNDIRLLDLQDVVSAKEEHRAGSYKV
jgi:hypothetical protein